MGEKVQELTAGSGWPKLKKEGSETAGRWGTEPARRGPEAAAVFRRPKCRKAARK
jgi:hypothetical protein